MWCRFVWCEVGILYFRNRESKEEESETDGSTVINHGLPRIRCYSCVINDPLHRVIKRDPRL